VTARREPRVAIGAQIDPEPGSRRIGLLLQASDLTALICGGHSRKDLVAFRHNFILHRPGEVGVTRASAVTAVRYARTCREECVSGRQVRRRRLAVAGSG
jgi:hypothetical protein